MPRMHVFVDGSWLFKACGPEKALAAQTEWSQRRFDLDFARLDHALLAHLTPARCDELGDRYLATSVFSLPDDFDEWPQHYEGVTAEDVKQTRSAVNARSRFVDAAVGAGYLDGAVYRPRMKGYMLSKLKAGKYQEKQVDASVVALLVRSAIVHPDDYHVLITGDADMLPAVKVAYPEYSRNVLLATTHPDELKAERRQTSFSYANFSFDIDPFFFQDHVASIMSGKHVYTCAHCRKAFARPKPVPAKQRPCCRPCHEQRT